jgi:hypothetical protein
VFRVYLQPWQLPLRVSVQSLSSTMDLPSRVMA